MNILVLCHEIPPVGGGGGLNAFWIAQELARNHRVDIITAKGDKGSPPLETVGGLSIHRVGFSMGINVETSGSLKAGLALLAYGFGTLCKGHSLCKKTRYDLVLSHYAIPAGFLACRLARKFGLPHVLTLVEADLLDPRTQCTEPFTNPLARFMIRSALNQATALAAISKATAAAAAHYGVNRPIEIVPCAVPDRKPELRKREELGLPAQPFLASFVGRLVARKGLSHLIKALSGMDGAGLVVMGDGPERASLEKQAAASGLSEKVRFLGALHVDAPKKFETLAACDVFVLPSLHEGFGIVLIEAMLCGSPVIATDCGGPSDIIRDGENGFLVKPGDWRALKEKLEVLRRDPELRRRIAKRGQEDARAFLPDSVSRRVLSLSRLKPAS